MDSVRVAEVDPDRVVRRHEPAGLAAGAPAPRVVDVGAVFALAGPALGHAEVRLRELVGSDVDVVHAVGRYTTDAGGKRLRPLLTALGCGAVGFSGDVPGLMCVGELLHLGSLLHDDVVDGGVERRGKPAAQHVYGNAAVILTGDFCLARAVWLAAEAGGIAAVTALGQAVTAMAEGEVLQLQRAGDLDTAVAEYLEMIEKKSAALIAWCVAAGALAAGDAAAAAALARFGRMVGIAFQITDDVLDYAPGTGKTPGQDLRERKLTLPLVYAMARLPDLRARLDRDDADIPALIAQIRTSGALDDALAEARRRVDEAIGELRALRPGPYRDALAALGHHLAERAA